MPQVVIAGDPASEPGRSLRQALRHRYMPNAVIVPVVPRHAAALAELLPWTRTMEARDGRATAYVCRDFACLMPTHEPGELTSQLNAT
jgi:uncharacterized protein YyaL (SSP411 family)